MRTISRGVRSIAKTGATFIAVAISPQPYCRPAHPELLGYLTHSGVLFQCGQRHLFANIHNRFLLERHRTSSASTFNDVETINLELSGKHQPGTYPAAASRICAASRHLHRHYRMRRKRRAARRRPPSGGPQFNVKTLGSRNAPLAERLVPPVEPSAHAMTSCFNA